MIETQKWDASKYLNSQEEMFEYLNACMETGDAKLIQSAIGDIAKAQGMSEIAQQAGVGRESLYKSLSDTGNPSFKTILNVIHALGGNLTVTPISA